MRQFWKDPDATLDYQVDWGEWLDDDTIATATWIVPAGVTKTQEANDDTTHTIWLSGGTVGRAYEVTSRITTAGGRTDDRTITINIRQR